MERSSSLICGGFRAAPGVRTDRGRAWTLGLQFKQIGEHVGLAAQFVGDHRGLLAMVETTVTRTPRRCIASTSERKSPSPENRIIRSICSASSMASTAKLDVHLALDLAAAAGVDEFLGRLGDDDAAVVVQPVDQRRFACGTSSGDTRGRLLDGFARRDRHFASVRSGARD